MKTIKGLALISILTISTLAFIGWHPSKKKSPMATAKNVIVLLKFKSQPEKGDKTVLELTKLIEKVKEEPHFVSIKLHVDPKNPTNVLLYEEWEDASYYNNEHMNTNHIKSFMANSTNFLSGPPDITFWEVQRVFE